MQAMAINIKPLMDTKATRTVCVGNLAASIKHMRCTTKNAKLQMIVYSWGLVLSIVRGSLPSRPTKCGHRLGATSGFGGCGFDWNAKESVGLFEGLNWNRSVDGVIYTAESQAVGSVQLRSIKRV
ncbi:hypothetical protein ABVK25_009858 [Lepraria finkii]|uniref:Uncharacterized protein n=1 Tax=Lepraria finkii TaxID=1340010 RepID=A0ABR4AW29_9LECA